MIHTNEEARNAAKRASMLKDDEEIADLTNENQVRDSSTLNSPHDFNADAFIPSSIFDRSRYHQERKIMTQQEYNDTRALDQRQIMDRKLLWQNSIGLLDQADYEKLNLQKQFGEFVEDDANRGALLDHFGVTEEQKANAESLEKLTLRSLAYQKKQIMEGKAQTESKLAEIATEQAKLDQDMTKALQAMDAELTRQENVNPDEIKTDDLTVPGTTDDEHKRAYREKRFAELQQLSDWTEIEHELQKGPPIRDYWNKVTEKEIEMAKNALTQNKEVIAGIFDKVVDQDIFSSELSELEKADLRQRKYRVGVERDMSKKEIELERKLIFFEEQNQYIEFAKGFLAENGEGMSKEELDKLHKVQEMIRQGEQMQVPELNDPLEMDRKDMLRKTKYNFEQIQKDSDVFGAQASSFEEDTMPNLDYETIVKQEQGTYDGKRRFERIDRVSHDAPADKFNKLKLAARHGRVYDSTAALETLDNANAIATAISLTPHLKKVIDKLKDPKANRKEEMPSGLTEEQQKEWKVQESMKEQLAMAQGRVERDVYLEDWLNRDKAAMMASNNVIDNDLIMLEKTGMKQVLTDQYNQARDIEKTIVTDRQEVANKLKQQKKKLEAVIESQDALAKKLMKTQAAQFEHQAQPSKIQLFNTRPKTIGQGNSRPKIIRGAFSPDSREVSDYENELLSISQLGLHKTIDQKDVLLRQFEFVFDAMHANRIPMTPLIRARMFEYLTVRNDFAHANTQLQKLTNDMTENTSPIDPTYLSLFLRNSLKHDNIDGVAYLTNYNQRYKVDTSDMPIGKFHSMLDYYLNHNFDLSKIMVFCKFYRQFIADTINRAMPLVLNKDQKPGTLDEVQLKLLKNKVFAQHESLIDMRSLSRFLVRKTQSKQIIDPLTREDSLMGLIGLFTSSPDVYEASSFSKNNHIEPETVAEFFSNRLGYPDSFQQVAKTVLRLDGTKVGREFSTKMLEKLKAFQAGKNGALPASFTESALRDVYYKVRSQKLSPHTSEFLLYVLQQKSMHPEVIDLCENISSQEIAKYYLTESLMALKMTKGSYQDAVSSAFKETTEATPMSLTQRTKAIMLDNGPQAAYTYFQAEFAKMEEKAKQKKAFLVSLYDTLMPANDEVSFELFKDRYLQSQKLASRFAKEGFVVNQIERILADKNYDEIENVFNLYAVMREERLLENTEYFIDDTTREVIKLKGTHESEQLQAVRKRRAKLESLVGTPDSKTLKAIQHVMQDEQLTALSGGSFQQIRQIAKIFDDVTEEEAATIESRNEKLTGEDKKPPKQVNKDTVISELAEKGHDKNLVEKLYDLLDFDSGKAELQMMKLKQEFDINPFQCERDVQKLMQDPLTARYFTLEEDVQEKLVAIQNDYKQHIKGIVERSLTTAEALKILKEIESDPANAALRDGSLRADFDPEQEEFDEDEIAKTQAKFAHQIKKEMRYQEEFIDKLQADFPLLDIRGMYLNLPEPSYKVPHVKEMDAAEEQRITALLQECGIVDKNGHYDPQLRAQAEQAILDLRKSEKMTKLLEGEEVSFSEELSEAGLNDMLKRRLDNIEQHEANKASVSPIFFHEMSDVSDVEDQTDAQKVMRKFWETIDVATEVQLEKNMQEIITPRFEEEFLSKNIYGGLRRLQQYENPERNPNLHLKPRKHTDRSQNEQKMEKYRDSMLNDPIPGWEQNRDPYVLAENAHNTTAFSMKEELLFAMNKRKHEALPVMIKMFNQIQAKRIGQSFRLDDFETGNKTDYSMLDQAPQKVDTVQVQNISNTITKLNLLLNDSRSPLISALAETQKYSVNRLPEQPEQYYQEASNWISSPLDVDMYKRDSDKLAILKRELERIGKTVEQVDKRVHACIDNATGELNSAVLQQRKKEEKEANEKNMARLRLLHNEFNAKKSQTDQEAHKVRVMKDVLALELGQSFAVNSEPNKTAAQFPVFFALDLINFGLKRNTPAAIRLGEKLLSDSVASEQAKLPQDLAMSIKNYMLDYKNNMGYRDAMKITGPLNSSSLFHMQNQQDKQSGITFCLDDPYWQEFILKNRRREDQWRNPTVFAYQYRQYGLLGEILDMNAVQKKYDQAFSRSL